MFYLTIACSLLAACSASNPPEAEPSGIEKVAIVPGSSAQGTITIDGTEIPYVTITPAGFTLGDEAPVLLAFPPGRQDVDITVRFTTATYETEAVKRGWVVVSPVAPDGTLYFDGSEVFIPGFVEWMGSWAVPEGGTVHVVGASNGGLSTFRSVGLSPNLFASILAFPGYPFTSADVDNMEEFEGPIRMFVGAEDTGWARPMEEALEHFQGQGVDVTFETIPDEGHEIKSLADGVRIFDELDRLR